MTTLLLLAGLWSRPGGASVTISANDFFRDAPPAAVNCNHHLTRRIDRLEKISDHFPEEGRAFRQAFKWTRVETGGVVQLLGVPKRQQNNAPFFVVVPVNSAPHLPALILNMQPDVALLFSLGQELKKVSFTMSAVRNSLARSEHGIFFAKNSFDVNFYATEATGRPTLGRAMHVATTLADQLHASNVELTKEVIKQFGDLGRRFIEGFAWTLDREGETIFKYYGVPVEAALADLVAVKLERHPTNREIELDLLVNPGDLEEYLGVADAFGLVQLRRPFETQWVKARLSVVGSPEPFGKLRAHFPGRPRGGHADLKDGMSVTLDALKRLSSLRSPSTP